MMIYISHVLLLLLASLRQRSWNNGTSRRRINRHIFIYFFPQSFLLLFRDAFYFSNTRVCIEICIQETRNWRTQHLNLRADANARQKNAPQQLAFFRLETAATLKLWHWSPPAVDSFAHKRSIVFEIEK